MGFSNGLITAPVSTTDVAMAIGCNSNDVGTLCTYGNINKAALFCPRFTTTRPELELDSDGFNWIASQIGQHPTGNYVCPAYGVWVPVFTMSSMSTSLWNGIFTTSLKEWYIARPTADNNSFYCLSHFIGYYALAKITDPIIAPSVSKNSSGGNTVSLTFTTPAADGKTLSVSNLFGGKGYYFGAVIFRGTNKNGWTTGDTMLVAGTNESISTISSTTIKCSINDTTAESSTEYVYRIIPFVCNRANVTTSTLSDTTFYGLKINSDCKAWYEKEIGGVSSGEGAQVQFFNWKEGSNGSYYPNDKNTAFPPRISTPDIAIAYSETTEDYYAQNSANGMPYYNRLLNKYYKIEFVFNVVVNGGSSMEYIFTWLRSGTDPDINKITRDSRYDNTGGYQNELLFYVPVNQFWMAISSMVGSNYIEVEDMYANFYYVDYLGYNRMETTWSTYIP